MIPLINSPCPCPMNYREVTLHSILPLNQFLSERFVELAAAEQIRQTHFFEGRFENTYVDKEDIPQIQSLIDEVRQQAALYLGVKPERLRAGFWFNVMDPGQVTAPHHHDENDELLSAVYYLRVPEDSGELVLYEGDREVRIAPQEGKLVLFPPSLMHEVTRNNSTELRLSVAFNVGPNDGEENSHQSPKN